MVVDTHINFKVFKCLSEQSFDISLLKYVGKYSRVCENKVPNRDKLGIRLVFPRKTAHILETLDFVEHGIDG